MGEIVNLLHHKFSEVEEFFIFLYVEWLSKSFSKERWFALPLTRMKYE
jgi:hypothetical protein